MAQTDYKSVLADFIADINANNYSDDELLKAYPEFNNDKNLLDAAFSYAATVQENKYDEPTLQSKFPEFFAPAQQTEQKRQRPSVTANPAPTTEAEYQQGLQRQDAAQGIQQQEPEQVAPTQWTLPQSVTIAQPVPRTTYEQFQQTIQGEKDYQSKIPMFQEQWEKNDKPIFEQVLKNAEEDARETYKSVSGASQSARAFMPVGSVPANEMRALQLSNEQRDPQKVMNSTAKAIENFYQYQLQEANKSKDPIIAQIGSREMTEEELAAKYKEAGIMSPEDFQKYMRFVQGKMQEYFVNANVPKDKLDYFARKFIQGNIIAQLGKIGTQTLSQRQYQGAGVAKYEQEHDDTGTKATAVGADIANIVTDPLMWIMPGAGEIAGKAIVGAAGRKLAQVGITDAAGAATRAAMQRGTLRTAQRLVSGGVMMAGIDTGHTLVGQLYQTGDVNWGEVGLSALRGAATGAAFAGGHFLGEKAQKAIGDVFGRDLGLVAGKATNFATGTNIMVGSSVLSHIMQGGSLSDVDWGSEYAHAAAMQLFFDVQGGLKTAMAKGGFKNAWRALREDPTRNTLSKEEIEQFNKIGIAGNDAYSILKNLNGGKDFESIEEYYKALEDISANENIDTQAKYKLASLLYGNVEANVMPIYAGAVSRDEQGRYVVHTYDNGGMQYETRKFNSERDALRYQERQKEATRNNLKEWSEGIIRTQGFAQQMQGVTDEAIDKTINSYPQLSREDAYRVLSADAETLNPIERAIRKQMESYLTEQIKGEDVLTELRNAVSKKYNLSNDELTEILNDDYQNLTKSEKQIFEDYLQYLNDAMPRREQAPERRSLPQSGDGISSGEPTSPVATERERITEEVTNLATERTNNDGNIYQVSKAGDENKVGYIVGDVAPVIDRTQDKWVITNNDVVTVKWEDGTIEQMRAKDLDYLDALTPDTYIYFEVEHRMNELTAERITRGEEPVLLQSPSGNVQGFFQTAEADVLEDEYGNKFSIEELREQGWQTISMDENGNQTLTPIEEPKQEEPIQQEEAQEVAPNIETMNAEQLGASMVEFMGGKADAVAFLEAERDKADAEVRRTAKLQPSRWRDMYEYRDQLAEIKRQRQATAERYNKLQNAIAVANNYKTPEEQAAEAARKAAAEARKEARRQTEIAKAANGTPAEKWNAAAKAVGNGVTRTLPDGTIIKGHYVLAEAGAATPSHDPFNNWNTSAGFPTTEDGRNINDRDYKNDKDAQQITMQIAQTYDGQAVEQVPVVSSEGIIYDGNGRTIAGNIAAANNTDAAYLQSLKDNAQNFGFTPEQVASMQHPRVYFQTDEDMPYNTTTFAKFNAQEKKSQSSTNRAISHSKKLTDAARDNMLEIIDNYGNLDTFFSSEKGANDIIRTLLDTETISQQEVAGLTEQTDRGYILSPTGRDAITDMLIGAVFSEDTIRMLGNDKGLKQSILRAMPSIVENRRLGEYALTDNISKAIQLLYEARQQKLTYQQYLLQGNAFEGYVKDRFSPYEMLLAEEMSSGVDAFRNVLDLYNNSARDEANGQAALFEPRTAEDIKNEILSHYGKEIERAAANEPARPQTEPVVPSAPAGNEQVEGEPVFDADKLRSDASEARKRIDVTLERLISSNIVELPSPDVVENMSEKEAAEIVRKYYNGGYAGGFGEEIAKLQQDLHWHYLWQAMADEEEGKPTDWYDNISYLYPSSFAQNVTGSPYKGILIELSAKVSSQKLTEQQINGIEEAFSLYDTYADHNTYNLLNRVKDIASGNKEVIDIVEALQKDLDKIGLENIDYVDEAAEELRRRLQDIILRERGANSANIAENEEKNAENGENILPDEKKVVSLHENSVSNSADGSSGEVSKDDYTTYLTPEARARFEKEAIERNPNYAHPELAFIQRAVWDGVNIPLTELQKLKLVVEAEAKIAAHGDEILSLGDSQVEEYANRLLELGSFVEKDGKKEYTGAVRQERKAFIVIGRPAGGKSSVFADPLSAEYKARIIDSDDVKPWLDGYDNGVGSNYVQVASTTVAKAALKKAIANGDNVIVPRVGGNGTIKDAVIPLKRAGYTVELYLNDVTPETSYMRSMSRFAETGRYLSLSYLKSVKDKPNKTFEKYKDLTLEEYEQSNQISGVDTESIGRDKGNLPQLLGSGRGSQTSVQDGGRESSELSSVAEGGQGQLESNGGRQEVPTRLFDYAEWKNNDVPIGEKPKLVWKSERIEKPKVSKLDTPFTTEDWEQGTFAEIGQRVADDVIDSVRNAEGFAYEDEKTIQFNVPVGGKDGTLVTIEKDGQGNWRYKGGMQPIESQKAESKFKEGDKIVYKGKHNGVIIGVNKDGTYNFEYPNALGMSVMAINIPAEELQPIEAPHPYNMQDWLADGDFNAKKGQEVVDDMIDHFREMELTVYDEDGKLQIENVDDPTVFDHGTELYRTFEQGKNGVWKYVGLEPKVGENPQLANFRKLQNEYPDHILLFRVGDFYELYDKDAVEGSKILGITQTIGNVLGGRFPLAGFPFHALDKYLPMLVRAGKRVAICNTLDDEDITKKLIKRPETEIHEQEIIAKAEEEAPLYNTEKYGEETTEQESADSIAIKDEAEAIVAEAEAIGQPERPDRPAERDGGSEVVETVSGERGDVELTQDERDDYAELAQGTIDKIDKALDKVNNQLAILGYYEADEADNDFHEFYGYMKSAEKKALKDIERLAKQLADDLGIVVNKRKKLASANIAPAGGDITFRLPLVDGKELYFCIRLEPNNGYYSQYEFGGKQDDLAVPNMFWRIETPNASGMSRYGSNNNYGGWSGNQLLGVTYDELLNDVKRIAREYLPKVEAGTTLQEVAKKAVEKAARKKADKTRIPDSQQVLDLFSDVVEDINEAAQADNEPVVQVVETPKTTDNGRTEVRNDGQRESSAAQTEPAGQPADADGTLGGSEQPTDERPVRRGVGKSGKQHRVDDGERSGGAAVQPATSDVAELPESEWKNTNNYHARRGESLAPTSNKARYDANIAAIRLLKQLQDEGRQATREEKDILAQYSGWGGLGEFFKGAPGEQYYTSLHGEKSPYEKIKELLTDDELQAAQLSRNSAYYTPAPVIDTLWDIASRLGFRGGNILEGSAGIGNILALMPADMSHRSNIQAVEIDDITAGILAQLYPDAKTYHAGFQDVNIPNNSIDLAITNVPFVTGLHVYDKQEKDLSKRFGNIHDFCIAKNVRKLRQGGIGIFISASGTLDSSKDLRRWLNNEGDADVIGAFRLNRETFGGTNATSDIIVVRKRVNGEKDPRAIDVLDNKVARVALKEQEAVWNRKTNSFEEPEPKEYKLAYNQYFVDHPESMGGVMGYGFEHGETWREDTAGCYVDATVDQANNLRNWVANIEKGEMQTVSEPKATGNYEKYEGVVPFGSLILNSKGEICRASHGEAIPVEGINPQKVKGHSKAEVLKDYNTLKKAVEAALEAQTKDISDEALKPYLKDLNAAYDGFVRKYGRLNGNTSLSFLRNDVQWASIAALENVKETLDANGKKKVDVTKTDIFSKRVVGVQPEPKAENAKDGVILSVQQYGNIRPDKIAEWLGKSAEEVEREIIESRLGFRDPQTGNIQVRHEYLTGNVREKLAYAEEHNEKGQYDTNIEELRKVMPIDIPAHLIEFNLGSTWIPTELYLDYLKDKFDVGNLKLTHIGSSWVSNEQSGYGNWSLHNEKNRQEGVYSELIGKQVYGHELMLAAMNNVPIVVSETKKNYDGTTTTTTDKQATAACSDKISQLKDDFVDWARGRMQQDEDLADRVQKIYNDRFNSIVPMLGVDKMFLSPHLPGQNHKYTLYDHQQQAVVRATTQPVMLAHEVGTGKTITLISAAMEMRRLGTAKKPMIVVQNATTAQFVKEAKDLYPNAKILTVSERDRTKEGRQEFYAKIKYNDWDLIIVPQSVFDMIPDSEARMRDFIEEKIEEKIHAIEAAKEAGVDSKVTKRMERELDMLREDLETNNMSGKRTSKKGKEKDEKKAAEIRENAKARAEAMLDRRTDDVADFDDMGIDALLIDEAHNYKHLGFATMMTRGVKGVDPSYSKRAAALYLKCQSVYERNGHRNVVFATGTPISNTAAEIWTFMKYLMPKDVLKENDIYYFDDFVHNFGKINEQLEFATNGKFKANNRFAQYGNVPELMRLWLTCADCVLTREVGQVNDKVPDVEGDKAQDIFLPQSPSLIDIMAAVREKLDEYEHMSGKEKKENSHIPLTMYGIAKRAAIDPRLVSSNAEDEPLSKTNKAVEETLRSLEDSKKYNGTVAIFCDSYQNKQTGFNLFNEIKRKLVEQGVPEKKIAIIRSEMTDNAKQKIFDAVREGEIRVIMGSTQTLGTGVNIQTRLHTLIHMDAPDRPMDYTQRNGRIIRQGNMHKQWGIPVRVLRFGVEDSLDVTSYQRLKTKAGFIDSIMNGKNLIDNNLENRVIEDVEEGIFDNPVAMLSGSQYALLKSQAERDLRKWKSRKEQHKIDQILIANRLRSNVANTQREEQNIKVYNRRLEILADMVPDGKVTEYNIDGRVARNAEQLREAIKAASKAIQDQAESLRKGGYGSNDRKSVITPISFNGLLFNVETRLTRRSTWKDGSYVISVDKSVWYGSDALDMSEIPSQFVGLDNVIDHIEKRILSGDSSRDNITEAQNHIERMAKEDELMRQREGKPFEHQEELDRAQALVDEYTEKMKAEMAEKEAKYAQQSAKSVDLDKMDAEDDDEPNIEANYPSELDYYIAPREEGETRREYVGRRLTDEVNKFRNEYQELLDATKDPTERANIMRYYLGKLGADKYWYEVLMNDADTIEYATKVCGYAPEEAHKIVEHYHKKQPSALCVGNKYIFFFGSKINDLDLLRSDFVHEVQHVDELNSDVLFEIIEISSPEELARFLQGISGHDKYGEEADMMEPATGFQYLASEFLANAIEFCYNTPIGEDYIENLQLLGVNNEQLLNIIKNEFNRQNKDYPSRLYLRTGRYASSLEDVFDGIGVQGISAVIGGKTESENRGTGGGDSQSQKRRLTDEQLSKLRKDATLKIQLAQLSAFDDPEYSLRKQAEPKQTGIGYKVFYRGKDGKLYPPMVANPNGEDTPIGVWLDADAAPIAGESKTGRPQVKAGGKGTQGGSGTLAYRPGWHLGEIPYAIQFNRKDENGNKTLFPKDFVWAEVEYAADVDYQKEANLQGWIGADGKLLKGYNHAFAGLKYLPENGFYRYRTNPNPETDPWIITGAMKVNRVLSNEEVDAIVRAAGREPQRRQGERNERMDIIDAAKADRTYMRAPNGKKTLLNEPNWTDVRTKNFKRWFGDWQNDPEHASKVLDKNGEPMVVYHGTPKSDFTEFRDGTIWTFNKRDLADQYRHARGRISVSMSPMKGSRIIDGFMNIRNPFELEVKGAFYRIAKQVVDYKLNGKPYSYGDKPEWISADDVVKMVKEHGGYDGVIFRDMYDNLFTDDKQRGDIIVGFRGAQFKSASTNNGEYSESPKFNESYGSDDQLTRSEMVTRALVQNAKDNYDILQQALKKINADIKALQAATRMQADIDRNTVAALLNLVNTLTRSGGIWSQYMPNTTAMIATQIRNAIGREDITPQVNKIMDYIVDAQKQVAKAQWDKLRATKVDKLNISGVVAQGKVAIQGQHALKALNDAIDNRMTTEQIEDQIAESDYQAHNATDESLRTMYEGKRIGYQLAADYNERVASLMQERQQLRDQLADAHSNKSLKPSARKELVESLQRALRDNNLEQAEAYRQVSGNLQGYIYEQHEAAKDFVAKQDANREKIRDFAARDLAGLATNPHRLRTKQGVIRDMWDAFASPIRDLQSLLRLCGMHAPDGEGYLYNHFMRGWTDAADTERTGVVNAQKELDDKVSELTNGKYKTWEEASIALQNASRNMFSLTMFNGEDANGNPVLEEIPLTANNALYIYAVNKMEDGKMKLRAMNISESDVEALANKVRDEFGQEILDIVDWIQTSFFSQLRNRYNPTHEALFGAPMDAIENYFPLVINPNSRQKNEDLGDADTDTARLLTGTSTGAIKRRTKNQLPLDVRNADFFQQVIRHIAQMERWNAFAQWTRDANILFSDINFRNRVKGMQTIYGTGDMLYNYMKDAFRVAMGTYRADGGKADALSRFTLNAAKGVTAAKINFRVFTALKQLASFPAFFTYMQDRAFVMSYLRNWLTPHSTMQWAKENMPNFEKRISKRDLGDMRLMQRSTDWQWNKRVLEWSQKYGMYFNVKFDTLTCATGARAVYDSRYAEYLRNGFSLDQAERRALQDAEQSFNTSQQSSEGAYMAPIQQDRNMITAALTVFRTSPIQYTRNFIYHTRNILRKFEEGKREEQIKFRAEQYRKEGLSDEQAIHAAEYDYNKSIRADIIGVVVYGALLNILWRLAGQVPYLLFGNDDNKKKEILKKSVTGGALVSPVTGLLGGGIVENAIDGYGNVADIFAPELPIAKDAKKAMSYLDNDKYAEFASQALSVLMQAGTGFDPLTAADMIARVATTIDSEQDLEAAEQALRISQAVFSIPQSQYEQILIDQVIDERREYKDALADYQRLQAIHTAPIAWWIRDNEDAQKADKAAKTKFDKLIKERKELRK